MIPLELSLGLIAAMAIVIAALVAGGVTLAVALVKWNGDNRKLWAWNRALVDHIYRGSPPPPPAAPVGLFD